MNGFVYTLTDGKGNTYVGQAKSEKHLRSRLRSHKNMKKGFTVEQINGVYTSKEELDIAEAYGINHGGKDGTSTKTGKWGEEDSHTNKKLNLMGENDSDYGTTGESLYDRVDFDSLEGKERKHFDKTAEKYGFCNVSGAKK